MRRLIPLLILTAFLHRPAWCLTVGGRLTASLYTYEGQQVDTTTYVRVHQSLRLDVGQLARRELSFHTYLQGVEQAETDSRLRIYHAYLTWKRDRYRLQFGRQRIYAGVGYGSLDGVRGDLEVAGCRLTLYGGSLAPLDKSAGIASWSEGHLWGAKISTERFWRTSLSLSFVHREYEPEVYSDPGRFSEAEVQSPPVVRRLVGIDAGHRFSGGHRLYGRLDYDWLDGYIRRSEAHAHYLLSSRMSAQVEWFRRTPWVFHNSIFSVFPREDYQEMGARLHYRLDSNLQFTGHFARVFYDNDDAQRLGLIARIGSHYSIGYYRTMGYAQASDGLVGSVYYPFGRKLAFQGELDLAAYERSPDAEDREDLAAGVLGLTYRPTRKTFLQVQVQGLRNPVYASDLRLFLRGSWRFFRGES